MAYFVFIRSHFRTQGKLTTDCDGNTENGRNQRELFQWLLPRTTRSIVSGTRDVLKIPVTGWNLMQTSARPHGAKTPLRPHPDRNLVTAASAVRHSAASTSKVCCCLESGKKFVCVRVCVRALDRESCRVLADQGNQETT